MGLKILIVLLFIAVLVSLSGALVFILSNVQTPNRQGLYALGIRILLAAMLLSAIFYGLYTGKLGSQAPWDTKLNTEQIKALQQQGAEAK